MEIKNISFEIKDNGCRICAICDGQQIGSIFFVKIGPDKIMISDAEIEESYKDTDIELRLIEKIIKIAREQNRKIISICPYVSDIFIRHPEFDDVRLVNQGR